MRHKLSGGQPRARANQAADTSEVRLTVGVGDDGVLFFQDEAGDPVPEHLVAIAKKQQGDAVKGLIRRKCDEINAQVAAVGDLHLDTPALTQRPVFVPQEYGEPRPLLPVPHTLGFLDRLSASRRARIDAENNAAEARYRSNLATWESGLSAHRDAEAERRHFIEELIHIDPEAMEAHIEATLQGISWPRETLIAVELADSGRVVFIDVDLPEICRIAQPAFHSEA